MITFLCDVCTGIINLKASKTHKNKFERAMVDEFIVEAVDIGPLKKLRVGHDNCGTVGQPACAVDSAPLVHMVTIICV